MLRPRRVSTWPVCAAALCALVQGRPPASAAAREKPASQEKSDKAQAPQGAKADARPGAKAEARPKAQKNPAAPDAVRRPDQLTVGVGDELLGQLAPDGKTLYYLSNRNTLHELYQQELESARSTLLFDEGADVTWGRVSPDGRRLLYVSYREDAAGQLCVRDLDEAEAENQRRAARRAAGKRSTTVGLPLLGDRRTCLSDGSRAVQAQWLGPTEIILVSRSSTDGDLAVSRVRVGARLTAGPLSPHLATLRNVTSPTVSPDGRWLVYVPVERFAPQVGPAFAARAAQRLEAVRLDRPDTPRPLPLDLPGWSGQPALSSDGTMLYFTQFFNDTNQDGVIDASDNAVLFRVPFPSASDDAPARAARAFPQQLTDSSWNCQYPSPSPALLIATCARADSLDIYGLPLDGILPAGWDAERLRTEMELSTRRADALLLLRRLLGRPEAEEGGAVRRADLTRMILLHLNLDEFDAAEFYARKLEALTGAATRPGAPLPETAGLARVLLVQSAQRRAHKARERGRGSSFRDDSRARIQALEKDLEAPDAAPAARALARVVRSEIKDHLGDEAGALEELRAVLLDGVTVPAVLDSIFERADAFYRSHDDNDALYALARRLAEHPALEPDDRLRYARAGARALSRGKPVSEAQAALTRELSTAPADSELHFALLLRRTVLDIRAGQPKDQAEAAQAAVVALYAAQRRPGRRHAVMLAAGQRAIDESELTIVEILAQRYVDDTPRGTRQRRRAERLYQRIIEGRAYRALAEGRIADARADFVRVAHATGSLESHAAALDLGLRLGKSPAALLAEYADPKTPAAHFARAYLIAKELPGVPAAQHEDRARAASNELRAVWAALQGEAPALLLRAVLQHQRYLVGGDRAQAERADLNYSTALRLVSRNPRYRATVLEQLGLLQAQVGNDRVALVHFRDREQIPFTDPAGQVLHLLLKGRSLLRTDEEAAAAAALDQALALVDAAGSPEWLLPLQPLVLDRAALYNLAAGRHARALALYDRLLLRLNQGAGERPARDRVVLYLARASAALGAGEATRALADLTIVEKGLDQPGAAELLRWPHTSAEETLRSCRAMVAGLRARAHGKLGQLQPAAQALEAQRALLFERVKKAPLPEHLRPLLLVEAELAELGATRGAPSDTGRWLRQALTHADELGRRTGAPLPREALSVLWLTAELGADAGAAGLPGLAASDLWPRVTAAQTELRRQDRAGEPRARGSARLFELYEALTPRPGEKPAQPARVAATPGTTAAP